MHFFKAFIVCFIASINLYAQEAIFKPDGKATVLLHKPGKKADELYEDMKVYVKAAYGWPHPNCKFNDIDKKITLTSYFYDVLNRRFYPERPQYINLEYSIEITVYDETISIDFLHKRFFENNNIDYYINFSDLINGTFSPLIFDDDKQAYVDNFTATVTSVNYFIDNKIVRILTGFNLDERLYYPQLLNFSDDGRAEITLSQPGLGAETLYDYISYFLSKFYMRPNIISDPLKRTFIVKSGTFDIFHGHSYRPRRPVINSTYDMLITITDGLVKINFTHTGFKTDNGEKYNAKFSDVMKGNGQDITDKDNKYYYSKQVSHIVSCIKYYLDKHELKV